MKLTFHHGAAFRSAQTDPFKLHLAWCMEQAFVGGEHCEIECIEANLPEEAKMRYVVAFEGVEMDFFAARRFGESLRYYVPCDIKQWMRFDDVTNGKPVVSWEYYPWWAYGLSKIVS